eukprot:CAMPEP_0178766662 /NCGR_PEP_ID=MMETSP0744-20121128/19191_1 /TAXON_ID=913974 /ORGANISM="Nitzschia punctata, Strain CCMP561" /LENGTH=389 /DNA_ID=CAMNT_0020422413 /DNA_START=169 /DNA_END=1338 /DNA_ORIENTATION=-
MNTDSSNKKGCPCCSFDLFLPSSEGGQDSGQREDKFQDTALDDLPLSVAEVAAQLASPESSGIVLPIIVDTHCHAQLMRDRDDAYAITDIDLNNVRFQSLACSVEPADFNATLEYASTSTSILPALGVHPWYVESILSNEKWIDELEHLLLIHPKAIVGEIGLCKIAKWVRSYPEGKSAAMDIQRRIFKQQMELAAKLNRPVTVHCVDAHGIFLSVIKELVESSTLPPAIGMHSFTGTAHHVKQLLDFERQAVRASEVRNQEPLFYFGFSRSNSFTGTAHHVKQLLDFERQAVRASEVRNQEPLFYFGFSHAVNYAMCSSEKSRRRGCEAIQAVPIDRLMVESDVHHSDDVLGGTIGAISYVSWARQAAVKEIADRTARNGLNFLACGG